PEDRILQCHVRNLLGPLSPLIETYLREAGFLHVALIGQGCKLDPELISALVERWISETHTFHIPCGECTITLEYVHLQLGLLVDGSVVTGSIQFADWGTLRNNFAELAEDSAEEGRERYAQAYILQIIGGMLMPNKSRNLVHLRWLLKLVNFRGASKLSWRSAVLATLYREMCRATQLEKIKIFGWTPYEDPVIWVVILEEFFVNPNSLHVKVPFVTYATVEMHEANRVLRRFGFNNRFSWHLRSLMICIYDFLPTHENIIILELACDPEYMPWFKIHGKSYLYGEEVRRRHPHTSRLRQSPLNLRGGEVGPSSVPTQERLTFWFVTQFFT
ncbi:hypothetical protein Goarm_014140, partial [Gossypium armourianum]|nr:hypothetical protein [Gossypium armourianum]